MSQGTGRIPTMARFIVSPEKVVGLSPLLTAQLWLRTTWIRRGVIASLGKVDSGFWDTLPSRFQFLLGALAARH